MSHHTRQTSWGTPIPPPSSNESMELGCSRAGDLRNIDLDMDCGDSVDSEDHKQWNTVENIASLGLSFNTENTTDTDLDLPVRSSIESSLLPSSDEVLPRSLGPFEKWVKSLNRRATLQRRRTIGGGPPTMPNIELDPQLNSKVNSNTLLRRNSSSASSIGFVTTMKSASISLASLSIAPRSKRTLRSSQHHQSERSSCNGGSRASEDNQTIESFVNDEAVTKRAIQRRRILNEIITTEENYVADIKFLKNVYITLLASIPTISLGLRSSISRNLSDIVELHEELLGDLHQAVPHSEYTQPDLNHVTAPLQGRSHQRWRSLDVVPEHGAAFSWLQKVPGMVAETKDAAAVARVFGNKVHRLLIYEEYGAKYELMVKDVASTYSTIPQWDVYQKGLEALAISLASIHSQKENSRKSLTIGDLLVKPIQRVCRYPLLFAELIKYTPVCDCPSSHAEMEKVLTRLREMTAGINRSTDDPEVKATLEKTWLLQDRLVFPEDVIVRNKMTTQMLGHVQLCGVLHAAWQTRDIVDGHHVISILYRDCLMLATLGETDRMYKVRACIFFCDLRVEDVDNGKGLQCHTAPYSWKLVFECDHQLYELILSACSTREASEWRSRINAGIAKRSNEVCEQGLFTSLSLDIKALGNVFGKPGTVARRISIHRATTVGPKSALYQVIIKNTSAEQDLPDSASINRSQSLLGTNRIPVIVSAWHERARLEVALSDVWTRCILPYPSLPNRARNDNIVRSSASSVMKKLHVQNIASNFSKRSGSLASISSLYRTAEEDQEPGSPKSARSFATHERKHNSGSPRVASDRAFVVQIPIAESPQRQLSSHSIARSTMSNSPTATIKRLTTLRAKKSWPDERPASITPPLRTSSANSLTHRKISPVSEVILGTENQSLPNVGKRIKGFSVKRPFLGESLRSFFR